MGIDIEKAEAGPSATPMIKVESVSPPPTMSAPLDPGRPIIKQTSKYSFNENEMMELGGEGGTRESLGCMYERIWNFKALLLWVRHFLPVAALLAVPLALFATVYKDSRAGDVRLLGLFVWLEILWASLWATKLVAMLMPMAYVFFGGIINSGTRKYHPIVRKLETAISFVFWTIIAYATAEPVLLAWDGRLVASPPRWVTVLQRVALASIAVSCMILVQRFIIQLINITYSAKQFTTRITESKRRIAMLDTLYRSATRLHPPFCDRFAQEDYTILTGEVERKDSSPSKLLSKVRMAGREVAQAFGQMTADISGNDSLFNTQAVHTIVTEALEANASSDALARRIWGSLVSDDDAGLTRDDVEHAFPSSKAHDADELFALLDADQNGDVSLDEMIMTVMQIGQERIAIWRSTHDIKSAVRILDRFLQVCIFVGTALVYAAFFSTSFSTYLATIGTQLAAISFAISGTVQEFLGSCIFIFVKHPFDVGDRVKIDNHDMVVEKISLLYSVFRTIDANKTKQVPNITLNTMWIENISRSGAMRERINLQIAADTQFEDLERLRRRVRDQVRTPENRRDFCDDVDVELVSIGDMSRLEIYVEAEHKSNWHNERIRRLRRNKLMTAVVSAMRTVGIRPPGGGGATLGDEARPTYQVVVSEEKALAAKMRFKEEANAHKRVSAISTSVDDEAGMLLGVMRRG